MGMFDYVNYTCPCPNCGTPLSGFQSKSGPCLLLTLEPKDVRNLYTSCRNCNHWIEYHVMVEEFYLKLVKDVDLDSLRDRTKDSSKGDPSEGQ